MNSFDFSVRTEVVFGVGEFARLGELSRSLNFKRTLVVADDGLIEVGYVEQAEKVLRENGIEVFLFHDFGENPDSKMVEVGRDFAAPLNVDSIIGLGGGSSLDCAKGINFILTNGGRIQDYWGHGKAQLPMLPMIGITTTAGTGSEAQTYALISDAETHIKMACGDAKAAFRIALLDPALTVTQPQQVTAASGIDAIAHAVECYVTTKRNPLSIMYAREAWRLLEANFEKVLTEPENIEARSAMQLGAHYAGVAIENSMLGATHACANPLTQLYGTTHGVAIARLLPQVVRWNKEVANNLYSELLHTAHIKHDSANASETLSKRIAEIIKAGSLNDDLIVTKDDIETLAEEATKQWTGKFNPRELDSKGAREIYEWTF
jgi:alcohol dehydrogenase